MTTYHKKGNSGDTINALLLKIHGIEKAWKLCQSFC